MNSKYYVSQYNSKCYANVIIWLLYKKTLSASGIDRSSHNAESTLESEAYCDINNFVNARNGSQYVARTNVRSLTVI